MIVNKPSIFIYTYNADQKLLKEICAGIEEEGVLYEIHERQGELDSLAFDAAAESILGSGIGICGSKVAMQMKRLEKGHNVFELNDPEAWQCRSLGANSARAIKKMPFKTMFGDEQL